jgi:hypothetical protein
MDLTLSKKTKVKQSKRSGEGVTAYVTEHTPTEARAAAVVFFSVSIEACIQMFVPYHKQEAAQQRNTSTSTTGNGAGSRDNRRST